MIKEYILKNEKNFSWEYTGVQKDSNGNEMQIAYGYVVEISEKSRKFIDLMKDSYEHIYLEPIETFKEFDNKMNFIVV